MSRLRLLAITMIALATFCLSARHYLAGEASTMFPKDGPKVPLGLLPIQWPKDNPYTSEKAELGWMLYFDPRLSYDGTVACASCHAPEHAFTDGQPFSKGIKSQLG